MFIDHDYQCKFNKQIKYKTWYITSYMCCSKEIGGMTMNTKAMYNNTEVQIKKILVPIDGSEYSFNAAKCALKLHLL